MSVNREADNKLAQAKEAVSEAVTCLADIVVNRCDGWDTWTEVYQAKQERWLTELLRLRNEMGV